MNALRALRNLRELIGDDRGTTAIEYAIIATGVAVAIIAVVTSVGTQVQANFQSVATALLSQ